MKKMVRGLWGVIAAILLLATIPIPADAAVQTFHAKGEYTMSDYETPTVAEQRAFAYAKQSASEQAGVYVVSYTKSINAQISEDKVNMLAGTLLNVKNKTARKEAMPNGDVHIIVEIVADMDTSEIDKSLKKEREDREDMVSMYAVLQKDIARQQKENEEMKQKIAAFRVRGEATEELVKESKAQEREFLSNQKVEEAWELHKSEQYEAMLAACNEAIRLNPKNARAYNRRGVAYHDNKQCDRALEDYDRALAIDSNDARTYYNRGNIYREKREYERAIADYSRALDLDPKYVHAYNNRGHAYCLKKQYDKAIADCNRVLELDPKCAYAYNNRGIVYHDKGEYDKAIADYNRALELNPKYVRVYFNRGDVFQDKKQYDKAIADYNRVLELDPKYVAAYNNRGNAYFKMKDYVRAVADFQRAVELDPSEELYRKNLQIARNAKRK